MSDDVLFVPRPGGGAALAPDGRVALTLQPADWESRFFGRPFGSLDLAEEPLLALPPALRQQAVALAVAAADSAGYALVQAHLDVRRLPLASPLEAAGFRLVETRAEFLTRLDRRLLPRHLPPFGTAEIAVPADKTAVRALAHAGLAINPAFQSRFKDPGYFTPEETTRWFASWVESDFADPGTLVAVWRVAGHPVAFFGYARRGEHAGLPLYKSTLAVTAPHHQGHKAHVFLQTTLFDAMPSDEFWVRAVTQLTNGAIIHNNVALGRRLDRVTLTFFRSLPR